jgi:hypothetical protein
MSEGKERKIFACREHVEFALEEMVNQTVEPPVMETLKPVGDSTPACEYCGQTAEYVVANRHSATKCGWNLWICG